MKDKKAAANYSINFHSRKRSVKLAFAGLLLSACSATRNGRESSPAPEGGSEEPKIASADKADSASQQEQTKSRPEKQKKVGPKHVVLGPTRTLAEHQDALDEEDPYIKHPPENPRTKKVRRRVLRRQRQRERKHQREMRRYRRKSGRRGVTAGVPAGIVGGVAGGLASSSSSGGQRVREPMDPRPSSAEIGPQTKGLREGARVATAQTRFSTLATDVDTASYSRMRAALRKDRVMHPDSVRVEELINYFDYSLPKSDSDEVIRVRTEMGPAMWDKELSVLRVSVAAKSSRSAPRPKRNLVFLIDVSGSMSGKGGLDLVQYGFEQLVETLDKNDRVGIVVYAGDSGEILAPTSGAHKDKILSAIYDLEAGGSTHGSAGILLAYKRAKENFIEGGVNRVILATDGDFNVGVSSPAELVKLIEKERDSGVYLSVLGVQGGPHSDFLMEQLADHGNGNYAYLDSHAEARRVLMHEVAETLNPVADNVKIQVEFDPKTVKSHRLIGYHNRRLNKEDFKDDKKDAGDIGDGQMATALFEVELHPGQMTGHFADVAVRYRPVGSSEHRGFKQSHALRHNRLEDSSEDFRFSSAVTQFAQLMRGAEATLEDFAEVHQVAEGARAADPGCKRAEFVNLVREYVIARDPSGQSKNWSPVHCEILDKAFAQRKAKLNKKKSKQLGLNIKVSSGNRSRGG